MSIARKHLHLFSRLTPLKIQPTLPINPLYIAKLKAEIDRNIFPRDFRLPFELTEAQYFFDRKKIIDERRPYGILRGQAERTHQAFLRQYYLTYINYLEAINGDEEAIKKIKINIQTMEMFAAAGINTEYLSETVKSPAFRLALLGFLFLEVFYCLELSACARVKAINLLSNCTEAKDPIAEIANAFKKYIQGYELNTADVEPVYDLLPVDFFDDKETHLSSPHNELFMKNEFIVRYFPLTEKNSQAQTLDALLLSHPREAAQIFKSLLRLNKWENATLAINKKDVFLRIINLADLPAEEHEKVFGVEASFMPRATNPYVLERFAAEELSLNVANSDIPRAIAQMSEMHIKKFALAFFTQASIPTTSHEKNGKNGHLEEATNESLDSEVFRTGLTT